MTQLHSPGPKIGGRWQQCAIIFCGSRIIVNFVPKFVAIATGVGRGKILMTQPNSTARKYVGRCKQGAIIFHESRVVVNFVSKFVAMATVVDRGEI